MSPPRPMRAVASLCLAVTLALGSATVASGPAWAAKPKKTAKADEAEAKKLFKQAETHYKLGRFPEALDAYSRAYELKPFPAFLFNIAQCHMELKSYERALFFFEGYLREMTNPPNRDVVEDRMKEAHAALDKIEADRRAAEAAKKAEEERKVREETERLAAEKAERERVEAERLAAEKAAAEAAARAQHPSAGGTEVINASGVGAQGSGPTSPPPPPAEPEEPVYNQWWFWGGIGGAVVVVAGATLIALNTGGSTKKVPPDRDLEPIDVR